MAEPVAPPPDDETPGGSQASSGPTGHPLLVYTLARILVFGVVAGLLYLVGARGLLLLLFAVLISGLLSFVLLDRLRDRVSERVSHRLDAARERRERAAAEEDEIF